MARERTVIFIYVKTIFFRFVHCALADPINSYAQVQTMNYSDKP
jgi:hypothetical protein